MNPKRKKVTLYLRSCILHLIKKNMGLIKSALRKPITILVIVAGLFFFGVNAVRNIKIDIFPDLNLPVIYLSHPYGGYTPNQMEAYFGKQYVNLLLYVSGVKSIETKNIQGLTLIKLTFYEGTNMAQASAEVTAFESANIWNLCSHRRTNGI